LKAVRFLQKQMSYNAGEIAGFADSVADGYVKAGIAEWYKPKDVPGKPPQEIVGGGPAAQAAPEETTEETEGTKRAELQAGSGNEVATEEASGTEEAAQAPKPTSRRGR
jgi:hypothetical protein